MNHVKPSRRRLMKNGFAIVATLMIMTLLTVLAFAMMSLSNTSTRSVTIVSGMEEAKANARMALMLAIGELQEQMGPDQRISANGGILDDPNDNTDVILNPHWTGVWDSWKAGAGESSQHSTIGSADVMSPTYETNRNDYFRGWLLSLDQGDLNASNHLNVTLPKTLALDGKLNPEVSDTAIRLVGEGSLSDDSSSASDFVNARLIKVSDPEDATRITGRYGWWVGDESQKARIMYDSYEASPSTLTAADKIFRSQASGSMGNTSITGLESINGEAQIQKVTSLKTLDLVDLTDPPASDDPKVSQLNFHNSSIYSQGLLADVREGGLKRDLSTILERPISLTDNGPEFMLYEFDDPRFPDRSHSRVPIQDLAAYYQLYDHHASLSTGYSNDRHEGVHYNSTLLPNAIQMSVPDYDGGVRWPGRQRTSREYTTLYRQPVMTKIQYLLVVTSAPITATDKQVVNDLIARNDFRNYVPNEPIRDIDTHKLRVGLMPMVTLWNPTNLPLVMDKEQILEFSKPTPVIFKWRKHIGGGAPVDSEWFNLSHLTKPHGNQASVGNGFCFFRLSLGGTGTRSVTFAPGEVKVFSADPNPSPTIAHAMLGVDGRLIQFTTEGGVNPTINDYDPFAFFRMPNSAPAIRASAPHFFNAYLTGGEGSHMVFNSSDSISLLVANDTAIKSNWADSRTVANAFAIPGAAFAFSLLDPGYRARWQDGIDHIRHYSMISRHGTNAINRTALWEFNKNLITPAFPGGTAPINFDEHINAIQGVDLIRAGEENEAIGLLDFSMSLGCEVGTGSVGGFGGGRRIATRPFLHSPAGAPPFIDQVDPASLYNAGWDWQLGKVNNIEDSIVRAKPDSGNGYYGGGYTIESGTTHLIQREIPVLPPISIASLSHAQLGGFSLGDFFMIGDKPTGNPSDPITVEDQHWHKTARFNNPIGTDYQKTTATGQGGLAPHVQQAIGNSYAHPNIPAQNAFTTKTRLFDQDEGTKIVPFVDHSYLANKALWDEFFFSSISPQPAKVQLFGSTTGLTASALANAFFFNGKSLPNRRIKPHTASIDQAKLTTLYTESGTYSNGLADKIAAHLMVDGVFNVNATSVDAWKVFFSSLKGKPVAYLNGGLTPQVEETEGTMIGSGSLLNAAPIKTADISSPNSPEDQWKAGRELTDEEVEELAIAMVKQVKLRGPFLSLSEFVNRRLDNSNLQLAVKGALQSALDDTNVSINAHFRTPARMMDSEVVNSVTGANKITFPFQDAAKGPIAYGSAPYVDQADVLRHFSEQLTVRGDTFVVRAYGDSVDANGKIIARAWCEAVVQRMPEYVDSEAGTGDQAHTKQAALVSEANKRFGRTFQIISFRWLNSEEV